MSKFRQCSVAALTLFLLYFLQGWNSADADKVEIKCPEFCECDIYENLKRALCRHRKLVSIELNIPKQAQILDLSDNQISELGDKIFLEIGLADLKLLNLSHNKVRQIHFNGFIGLENLKTLDLSFNAVEYFTKSWFESLTSLEEFYLRGNKLRKINDDAPIDIKTLRVLDISNCGITRLDANIFKLIPNLEILDISDNFIQVIQVELLTTLPKLTSLKTHDNNFNCKDQHLIEVADYIKSRKMLYTDSCMEDDLTSFTINHKVHKFERMQMAVELESTTPVISPRNSWIFDDGNSNDTKEVEACDNGTKSDKDDEENSLLMDIIRLSPWMTISITFVYGILCGMVLTCALNLCVQRKEPNPLVETEIPDGSVHCNIRTTQSVPNLIARRHKKNLPRSNSVLYSTLQKARRHMSRDILDDDDDDDCDDILVMNEFELSNSTPVPTRKPIS